MRTKHAATHQKVRLGDKRFYEQVTKRKGEKVAIVAVARKLMRTMYIVLNKGATFRLDG